MIKLNLARNCLRYLIRAYGIKEIYAPYYSCNTVWNAIKQENCRIKFYHIREDFSPLTIFPKQAFILYINYFGLCNKICKKLAKMYPKLIVDNTQAFYSEPIGLASFNSLRKFFPVQNGAYLYTEKILKDNFEKDKELFTPCSMQKNYEKFVENELILNKEHIKYIYPKIEKFMENFDYNEDRKLRLEKYFDYDKKYNKYNKITIKPTEKEVPYCYPLSTDDIKIINELKDSKSPYLALWGEINKDFYEYGFLNNTVALPLTDY